MIARPVRFQTCVRVRPRSDRRQRDEGATACHPLDLLQCLGSRFVLEVVNGVGGDYLVVEGILGSVDAPDCQSGNELAEVVQHQPFGTADVKHRVFRRQTKKALERRHYRLPKPRMVFETAISLRTVTIEESLAELADELAIHLGFFGTASRLGSCLIARLLLYLLIIVSAPSTEIVPVSDPPRSRLALFEPH